MDIHTAAEYLRANFESADRLAVVALNRSTTDTKQRIATTERIAQDDFQRWLRFLNKERYEIYVSMNIIREDANGRKKSDIAQIRHVYLDFDVNGTEAVRHMLDRADMPAPNHLIETSPGKWQAVWRVRDFGATQAENLMRGMVREFGADPAAVDSARVLRLPGFYNHKYETPHFVRVENLSAEVYSPSQFPGFAIPEAGARVTSTQHQPSPADKHKLNAGISQSELDWAYAKRALARGEDPEVIIQKMAAFRSDKPNPEYYARYTVTKAAAGVDVQQKPKPQISLGLSPGL
jgi:RepB DNA-primase from phage plasmid